MTQSEYITLILPLDYKEEINSKIIIEELIFLKKLILCGDETIMDEELDEGTNEETIAERLSKTIQYCDYCKSPLMGDILTLPIKYISKKTLVKEDRKIFIKYKSNRLSGKIQPLREDMSYYCVEESSKNPPIMSNKYCSHECLKNFINVHYLDPKYRDSPIILYLVENNIIHTKNDFPSI